MAMIDKYKDMLSRKQSLSSFSTNDKISKNWYSDRYEWMVVQRNLLFVILLVSMAIIVFLNFSISYIKSTKTIEPFVIEIEPKTGVPTVVEPLSIVAYSSNEVINRYFIWHFIKLREEYNYLTSPRSTQEVRVLCNDSVYSQYRRSIDQNNLQSPYNLYGTSSTRNAELKSLIMQNSNTAQVRIRLNVEGAQKSSMDKIILLTFEYNNLELPDDKRLINPLGFTVTSYRIDDERL
ncbi:MAG: type secretion system protein VirB8 [Candidatus Midichloriaceae bacterium]|jgi:type IV secretion system protein VirB8|nr:type secretion system protein VirB8 [Candidatus Midichloriaceae bacterium]